MTLAPGTRLGPYEILAPLGAGGMGEVYRARDPKLGRDVAVKVLPPGLSRDPDRLKRFERESRAASALSHPSIVTVYEIGESEGIPYLAMELVVGRTVRDLLAEGPLPMRKLLAIAAQVADGLAKAHGAGIVHRDLKPENVMVTTDGFAKVLDFGLAKLTQPEGPGVRSLEPTLSMLTGPGIILGTVSYMSPEQAAGKAVDFRSDQFAFGSMLYEMLTGRRPFGGASGPETLTAILREEPEPVDRGAPRSPVALRWIVERCLAKDPDERYASTRDLARDLARLRDGISETIGPAAPSGVAVPVPFARRWALPTALVVLVGAVAGIGMFWRPRPQPPEWHSLTFRRGTINRARFAPDGQTVLYAAAWEGKPLQLYSTRLDSTESTAMPFPSANLVGISAGGRLAIALQGDEPILSEVPLAGGAPRELLAGFMGADWVLGEEKLAVVRRNRLEFPIGKVLYEPPPGRQITPGTLRASPKGDAFALVENNVDVVLVDRVGKRRALSEGWETVWALAWNPKTDEVWFSAREAGRLGVYLEIHAVSRSGRHRVVARGPSLLSPEDILPDGRVLVKSMQFPTSMMCLPSGGVREVNLSWLDFSCARDLSADGKWILFDEAGVGGGSKGIVYLRGTDGSSAKRLGEGYAVGLSPDGKWAISLPSLPGDRLVLLPTGAGDQKEIRLQGMLCSDARWFPDSKRILVSAGPAGQPSRLYVQDLEGGSPRALTGEGFEVGPVSPDGRFAAVRNPEGRPVLWPVDGGGARPLPGTTPTDRAIQWQGSTGLYLATGDIPVRIDRYDLATAERRVWKEVGPADPAGVNSLAVDSLFRVIVSPDGKSYAYSFMRDLSQLFVVRGLE